MSIGPLTTRSLKLARIYKNETCPLYPEALSDLQWPKITRLFREMVLPLTWPRPKWWLNAASCPGTKCQDFWIDSRSWRQWAGSLRRSPSSRWRTSTAAPTRPRFQTARPKSRWTSLSASKVHFYLSLSTWGRQSLSSSTSSFLPNLCVLTLFRPKLHS